MPVQAFQIPVHAFQVLRQILTRSGPVVPRTGRRESSFPSCVREQLLLEPEQVDEVAAHIPGSHRAVVYVFAYGGLRWVRRSPLRAFWGSSDRGVGFGDMCAGVERVAIGRLEYAFGHRPVGWTWCSRGSIAF